MTKTFLLTAILGFSLFITGCAEKKTTDEQLKENTQKEVDLIKKSISEKASKVEKALKD